MLTENLLIRFSCQAVSWLNVGERADPPILIRTLLPAPTTLPEVIYLSFEGEPKIEVHI